MAGNGSKAPTSRPETPPHLLSGPAGLAIAWVDLSGCLVAVTPEVGAMYGYPSGTMVGQPAAIVLPEARRPVLGEILETIRRVPVPPYLALHRHRDGSELLVEVAAAPSLNADGAVTGMVIVLRDLRLEGPERQFEGSHSLGLLVGSAGALAFQLDQRMSPPAWFLCGDRSLIGLEGEDRMLTPLVANASTQSVRATLEALATEVLDSRPSGSRASTVTPPARSQRWLAVRPPSPRARPAHRCEGAGCSSTSPTSTCPLTASAKTCPPRQHLWLASALALNRLEYVSGSACHFTGYAPQELLEGGLERLRGCLSRSLLDRFDRERENGPIDGGSCEYRTFRRDGSSLWVRTEIRVVDREHGGRARGHRRRRAPDQARRARGLAPDAHRRAHRALQPAWSRASGALCSQQRSSRRR